MRYKLDKSPNGKIDCPNCNAKKTLRVYIDSETGQQLRTENGQQTGICDRSNNCGYWIKPDGQRSAKMYEVQNLPDVKIMCLDHSQKETFKNCLRNQKSNFHLYCQQSGIPIHHLQRWGIGTDNDKTIFVFIDSEKTPCNVKYFKYLEDGHRDKSFNSYSLKSRTEGNQEYKYKICLFGEHLLSKDFDRYVVLVESEKTASIAAFHYQKYEWVSCASGDGLTDAKAKVLKGRKVIWLCDADDKGRKNASIQTLKRNRIQHKIIDLSPDRKDGTDIADLIQEGVMPNLEKLFVLTEFERTFDSVTKRKKGNVLEYLKAKRLVNILPNIFKDVFADKEIAELRKLESFIKIRVEKSEDVYDLEFLALIESVLYKLKVAYHTAEHFNRESWIKETLIRERKIKSLKEGLQDALSKNETCQSVIYSLQMLAMQNANEIKSLQSNLTVNVPNSQRETRSKESKAIRIPTRNGNSTVKVSQRQVND